MLLKAEEGHIVNTSSVNGFWASVGPRIPHTAYAAAKFAVKGFTEALITDLRINAPHIKCSVVMPGHIGTSIRANSRKIPAAAIRTAIDASQMAQARARIASMGRDVSSLSDEEIRRLRRRTRAALSRRGADQRGRGGQDHPRRRQGRALAHSGRRGRCRSSTRWCARRRNAPTTSISSRIRPRGRLDRTPLSRESFKLRPSS